MSAGTTIEWTDTTWNVVSGCTRVSPACDHCYIERTPPLRMARRRFDKPGVGGSTGILRHEERMFQPFHWRKPLRVFVCSLADLFHDDVPELTIAKVWATMARTPKHTYQVLTKRPARMRALLSSHDFQLAVETICGHEVQWPLLNVHGGVTAENQKWADARIPILVETPLAVRWVSVEPLLNSVHLAAVLGSAWRLIDWVVVGGETGPKARPMNPRWALSLRDQCAIAGIPFFFKQWGDWAPAPWKGPGGATHAFTGGLYREDGEWAENFMELGHSPTSLERDENAPAGACGMRKVGKKAAGRELDGRTYNEYPRPVMI